MLQKLQWGSCLSEAVEISELLSFSDSRRPEVWSGQWWLVAADAGAFGLPVLAMLLQ